MFPKFFFFFFTFLSTLHDTLPNVSNLGRLELIGDPFSETPYLLNQVHLSICGFLRNFSIKNIIMGNSLATKQIDL